MSHVAVWTDANERVKTKNHKPDEVDTSEADAVVENGNPPDTKPWQKAVEYYNDSQGFYYQIEDPLEGVSLTAEQEILLEYAYENEHERKDELINEYGGSN